MNALKKYDEFGLILDILDYSKDRDQIDNLSKKLKGEQNYEAL